MKFLGAFNKRITLNGNNLEQYEYYLERLNQIINGLLLNIRAKTNNNNKNAIRKGQNLTSNQRMLHNLKNKIKRKKTMAPNQQKYLYKSKVKHLNSLKRLAKKYGLQTNNRMKLALEMAMFYNKNVKNYVNNRSASTSKKSRTIKNRSNI